MYPNEHVHSTVLNVVTLLPFRRKHGSPACMKSEKLPTSSLCKHRLFDL